MTTTAAQNAALCNRAAEIIREKGWFRMPGHGRTRITEKKTDTPACLLYAIVRAEKEMFGSVSGLPGGWHVNFEQQLLGLDVETSVWNDTHTKRDVLNLLAERAAYWENPTVFI
jgi:hypothetical protein